MKWPINACRRCQSELSDLATQKRSPDRSELNFRQLAALDHLESCAPCKARYSQLHRLAITLQRCAALPNVGPSLSFHRKWTRQLSSAEVKATEPAGTLDLVARWLCHRYAVRSALAGIWLLAAAFYVAQPAAPESLTTAPSASFSEILVTLKTWPETRSIARRDLERTLESKPQPSGSHSNPRSDRRLLERRVA